MTQAVKDVAASLLVVWNTLQAKLSTAVRPDDLLMTPEEVAAYTGLSVQALAMMRHRKQGPAYSRPTPRTTLYRKGDIDTWVRDGHVAVVAPDDARLQGQKHVTIVPAESKHDARTPMREAQA